MPSEAEGERSFFARLSPEQRRAIEALAKAKRVKRKEEVFRKGASAHALYLVVEGRARVTTPSADGRDYVIRELHPGDLFGEVAIFDREPRTANVRAVEDTVLGVIDSRDFREHLKRHPDVALLLLECFAERVRDTTEALEDNVFLTIEARLAKTLLHLAEVCGSPSEGGLLITEPISQSLLGQMVGTAREEVNRRLRKWVSDGVIRREDHHIRIVDQDALEDLASGFRG